MDELMGSFEQRLDLRIGSGMSVSVAYSEEKSEGVRPGESVGSRPTFGGAE